MKWDIDKALAPYEPNVVPGTIWQRTMLDVRLARAKGVRVPAGLANSDSIFVWTLCIGQLLGPKEFVYGHTMRECFLRLRKLVKSKELVLSPQIYPGLWRKPKPKERPRRKKEPRGTAC